MPSYAVSIRSVTRRGRSGGGSGFRGSFAPVPRQQLVQTLNGMIRDATEDVDEPCAGIDIVEFRGLCRPPNYAERARFGQKRL
jgi:hypothetical protein